MAHRTDTTSLDRTGLRALQVAALESADRLESIVAKSPLDELLSDGKSPTEITAARLAALEEETLTLAKQIAVSSGKLSASLSRIAAAAFFSLGMVVTIVLTWIF